ncbi:hypothetical protein ZOSMA_271G00130 [Zostera marina]|uniref:Uncharacterized protein n=1 Tax=Zostera marina TaxID=29655 RepID=A0A0K9PG83_ZOSMR|nr:hypothetical protein ZOSMA_271G00130 [Zostera marina]
MSSSSFNNAGTATFDSLLLQSLMGRLQLRPPYLDTNSFLSQSLDEFLLGPDPNLLLSEVEEDASPSYGECGRERSLLEKEEAKLEREIIRIVHSGSADEALKPNSGQSVAIGEHHICVGFHQDPGTADHRVWEWHGHVMLFDEENGYSPEYVYGNYFERLPKNPKGVDVVDEEEEEEDPEEEGEEEEREIDGVKSSGLKDLIGDGKEECSGGRVIHRNFLNTGSTR